MGLSNTFLRKISYPVATNPQAPGMTKITFQVSKVEKAQLMALADISRMKLSAFLRDVFQDAIARGTHRPLKLAHGATYPLPQETTFKVADPIPDSNQGNLPESPAQEMIDAENKRGTAAPVASVPAPSTPLRSRPMRPHGAKK